MDRAGRVGGLRRRVVLAVLLGACVAGPAVSSTPGDAAPARSGPSAAVWLCRPGMADDPCTASLRTTVIGPNGSAHVVDYEPASDPPIDCFYVYPNVSRQRTANANLHVDPQETAIAELEASPFSRVCRVYAPMYREATGQGGVAAARVATASVQAAWRDYLVRYNRGRGVVLIGHSEGTYQLGMLIIDRIEHDPSVRPLLVSALLIGGNLPVRTNGRLLFKDQQIQPCRSATQTGCVIGYDSYSAPPPPDSMFGRQSPPVLAGDRVETLCTNPASLAGGSGTLDSLYRTHLPTQVVAGSTSEGVFGSHPPTSATPWIEFADQYSARCVEGGGADVLMVRAIHRAPALTPAPNAAWGLHLDDPNVALGNLVALVGSEATAYVARHPRSP